MSNFPPKKIDAQRVLSHAPSCTWLERVVNCSPFECAPCWMLRRMVLELKKVLISDSVDVSCREILEAAGISVDYKPGLSKTDLISIIKVCERRFCVMASLSNCLKPSPHTPLLCRQM